MASRSQGLFNVVLLGALGMGLSAAPLADSGAVAKGVGLSLHGKDPTAPAARVRIEKITVGAQRRGFFRIAALPMVVGEAVEIRFLMPDATALAELRATFSSVARSDVLELKEVRFVDKSGGVLLTARSAEVSGDEAWRLSDVVLADGSGVPAARLSISGDDAGRLRWTGDGETHTANLFPGTNQSQPKAHR